MVSFLSLVLENQSKYNHLIKHIIFAYSQEFQVGVYMRQYWHDPRLAYGKNNTSVILQGDMLDKMWLPDTYIENSVKTVVDKDTKTAFVTANGSVFLSYRWVCRSDNKQTNKHKDIPKKTRR